MPDLVYEKNDLETFFLEGFFVCLKFDVRFPYTLVVFL